MKELGLELPEKAAILGATAMSLWFPDVHAAEERKASEQRRRTQLEAAKASSEGDDDEDSPEVDERAAELSNVVDILTSSEQKPAHSKPGRQQKPKINDADLAALLDVTNQLDAMLGKVDTLAADVHEFTRSSTEDVEVDYVENPLAEAFADFEDEGEDESGAEDIPATDVSALLANQNYKPLNTEHIGLADDEDAGSDDEEQFDLSVLMDVANQLNSTLDESDENDDDLASA